MPKEPAEYKHIPATQAISYLRYSSLEQAKGGSEKRQGEWAEEYCEENNLTLVDTYKDLGISALRGKHAKGGKLAQFIKDCASGKIPKGYALIIENFDRLSREEVPIALQRFLTLINDYKLEIHTLDDNRVYIPGKIELTELIITIVIMGRANSESARKSVLIGKAWEQKREAGRAFSRPGKKPMGRHPKWLGWDDKAQSWIVDEDIATTIRYVFKLAIEHGLGRYMIARRLNEEEVPIWSPKPTKWTAAMIKRITNNRSLLGEFVPARSKDKRAKTIPDFYPQIITPELYKKCEQAQLTRNTHTTGRPSVNAHQHAILTGMGYYLGQRIHKGYYKVKSSGKINSTYCCMLNTVNKYLGFADHLEHFVCSIISELDAKELSANTKNSSLENRLDIDLSAKKSDLSNLKKLLNNQLKALEIADDIPELVKSMQQTKHDIKLAESEISDLEKQLSDIVTGSGIHNREEVALLKDKALGDKDLQSRQDIQIVLSNLIKRLDLGKHPDDLPEYDNDFTMHALTLHATTPIKFWAKITLFNDNVILGAMTTNGKIARIRWEEGIAKTRSKPNYKRQHLLDSALTHCRYAVCLAHTPNAKKDHRTKEYGYISKFIKSAWMLMHLRKHIQRNGS